MLGAASSLARRALAAPSLPGRLACRARCAAAAEPVAADADAAPRGFTSDMRPAGDTSRKWVKVDAQGRAYATGRRKSAIARVWLWETPEGRDASVRINRGPIAAFFGGHWIQRHTMLSPFFETGTAGRFSVMATVKGGGLTGAPTPARVSACQPRTPNCARRPTHGPPRALHAGQTEALRLGIATAMQGLDASLRPPLKAVGMLKRDARVSERKKAGQKGARAKFAWVKR